MAQAPAYEIRIVRRAGSGRPKIDTRTLKRALRHTLAFHNCSAADIGVVLVDDPQIERLNQEHLRHNGPTDVITLDYGDGQTESPCGDIFISLDTARREAESRGLTVAAEATLYAVHGTLHLLGYDDRSPAAARRMHELEDRLLDELCIGRVFSA